jgi:alkanesulfonate monooxygenase
MAIVYAPSFNLDWSTDADRFPPWLSVFSTCPPSSICSEAYLENVIRIAQWSDRAGCTGILVYADNSLADPWLVAQVIIQNTRSLCPLIAVQPVYMHPYSAAKMVASLAFLHQRRVYLNMIAGGFRNDLATLNDPTAHDSRYDRMVEYTGIIRRLLEGEQVTFSGTFYTVNNLLLKPSLPRELLPGFLMSGSSQAGLAAARIVGATPVRYPASAGEDRDLAGRAGTFGIRVGIIARPRADDAWAAALERFPEDRQGQLSHQLAMKVSDSEWHKQLSELGSEDSEPRGTYWLVPFNNYKTFCPYLVGNYSAVAAELKGYFDLGCRACLLDVPASEEEFKHITNVLRLASQGVQA